MVNRDQQLAQAALKARAQAKAVEFSELFRSEAGMRILSEIKEQFDRPVLCAQDSHSTVVFAAQRDVVRWIEDMIFGGDNVINQETSSE